MLTPWKRAKARQRNAGYREGYAAGLRDAARLAADRAAPGDPPGPSGRIAHELADLARTAQLTADLGNAGQ